MQESLDWAEAEEKRELEQLKLQEQKKQPEPEQDEDPLVDDSNREWVEKQLKQAKELYGQDFGEDLSLNKE